MTDISEPELSPAHKVKKDAQRDAPGPDAALRSVHTPNFPDILRRLGISLLVSTYQAGRLILVREDKGTLNTHFRTFRQPMGLAVKGHRLAVGCKQGIWELRNMPDVARKTKPPGRLDAFFLPRNMHITGDIDVHEMAWDADGRLCFVNTRFSTSAHWTTTTVSCRSGGRILSQPILPKTDVISTGCA